MTLPTLRSIWRRWWPNDATATQKRRAPFRERGVLFDLTSYFARLFFVLCRPGSDLLSQGLSHSTIGAEEFNGRVRDGIGFKLLARTTRPAKDKDTKQAFGLLVVMRIKRYGH